MVISFNNNRIIESTDNHTGDEIARMLVDYSIKEKYNRTTSDALKTISEHLANIEDYRHTEHTLKAENTARKRETMSKKKLEKSQTVESIRQAEIQLHQSINDSNQCADNLERCMVEFEARRLKGLKSILKDFVQIEMLWHAKALESLGDAFNALQGLHEQADLAEFQSSLMRSGRNTSGLETNRSFMLTDGVSSHHGHNRRLRDSSLERSRHSATEMLSHPNDDVVSLFTEDGVDYGNDHHHQQQQQSSFRKSQSLHSVRNRNSHGDVASEEEDSEEDSDDQRETETEESQQQEEDSEVEDSVTEAEKSALSQSLQSATPVTGMNGKPLRTPIQSPLKSALKSSSSRLRN